MAKIVCVLYPDPVDGYPPTYARDEIPVVDEYPDGQALPKPQGLSFRPGELVGCVSGELGLRAFLENVGTPSLSPRTRRGPVRSWIVSCLTPRS